MTVGERIKKRRIELGMTQDELAHKCGYKSRSSVNKIELARDLPLKKATKMAQVLDCEPGYLLGWNDVEPSDDTMRLVATIAKEENSHLIECIKLLTKLSNSELDKVCMYVNELLLHE